MLFLQLEFFPHGTIFCVQNLQKLDFTKKTVFSAFSFKITILSCLLVFMKGCRGKQLFSEALMAFEDSPNVEPQKDRTLEIALQSFSKKRGNETMLFKIL